MDPVTIAMIGAPIVTDLLGQWLSKADREEQEALAREAIAIYGDASPPTLERMLKEKLGPSAMESIPRDLGSRAGRDAALRQLLQIGSTGGMEPGSMLAVEQARRAGAQASAQGQAAVRQEMQRRGLGGAGVATLALQAQQAGADRTAMGDMQAAADARTRALQALTSGAGLAGQFEAQDFDREARRAQSMDAIARFNADLATNALQQNWQNQVGLMDRRYGALMGGSQRAGERAGRTQQRVGNYGQAALGGLGVLGGGGRQPTAAEGAADVRLSPAERMDYDLNDPRYRRGP